MRIKYILVMLLITAELYSQGGNSGLKFLTTTESRLTSMGETTVINSAGASATLGNPAGLNLTNPSELQIGVMKLIQDINSQYLLLKLKSSGSFTYGFHLLNYKVSDIEIRDIPGESQGTFSSQYLSTGLSAAYQADSKLSIGATAKFLYEKIYVEEASGYAFDLGGYYRFNENLHFGASITNIGNMSNLAMEKTKLPLTAGIGASYRFGLSVMHNIAAFEIKDNLEDKKMHLAFAIESQYNDLVFARVGYMTGYDSKNISMGLGVQFWDMVLNYSFVPYSYNLGDHHSISLSFNL